MAAPAASGPVDAEGADEGEGAATGVVDGAIRSGQVAGVLISMIPTVATPATTSAIPRAATTRLRCGGEGGGWRASPPPIVLKKPAARRHPKMAVPGR